MYTKILVPLDGSETAECVLPYLRWFVKVSSVNEIVFLRVVEPFKTPGGVADAISPSASKSLEKDASMLAKEYLEKIGKEFQTDTVAVNREVLTGKTSETIAKYVAASDVDLIIMATHGYSGIHRWVRGSVADEIVNAAKVPVLLVDPKDKAPES